MINPDKNKNYMYVALTFCAASVAILALVFAIKNFSTKDERPAVNVINVEGKGSIMASPDIAFLEIIVRAETKKTSEAQNIVKTKAGKAIELLKRFGVKEKDIKTENYATTPKYYYQFEDVCENSVCNQRSKPILSGYEVTQNISVKIRKLDDADAIISALGVAGINEIYNFSFIVENDGKFKEEARKMAIDDAKSKAELLSNQLGVRLVRITSFSEQNYDQPRFYAMKAVAIPEGAGANNTVTSGQNKISSTVFITYEID